MACDAESEPRQGNLPAAKASRVEHQQRAHDAHALCRLARDLRRRVVRANLRARSRPAEPRKRRMRDIGKGRRRNAMSSATKTKALFAA